MQCRTAACCARHPKAICTLHGPASGKRPPSVDAASARAEPDTTAAGAALLTASPTSSSSHSAWVVKIPLRERLGAIYHPRYRERELANYGTEEWILRALLRAPHCCAAPDSHNALVAVLPARFTRAWQEARVRKADGSGLAKLASLHGEAADAIRRFEAVRSSLALPRLRVLVASSNTAALDYLGSEYKTGSRSASFPWAYSRSGLPASMNIVRIAPELRYPTLPLEGGGQRPYGYVGSSSREGGTPKAGVGKRVAPRAALARPPLTVSGRTLQLLGSGACASFCLCAQSSGAPHIRECWCATRCGPGASGSPAAGLLHRRPVWRCAHLCTAHLAAKAAAVAVVLGLRERAQPDTLQGVRVQIIESSLAVAERMSAIRQASPGPLWEEREALLQVLATSSRKLAATGSARRHKVGVNAAVAQERDGGLQQSDVRVVDTCASASR
eukprot:6069182-Prymnesium_polylepis.2